MSKIDTKGIRLDENGRVILDDAQIEALGGDLHSLAGGDGAPNYNNGCANGQNCAGSANVHCANATGQCGGSSNDHCEEMIVITE